MSLTSHHGERGSVTGTRGLPAIHSSISDMMGFGHVPTGSIGFPAAPETAGHGVSRARVGAVSAAHAGLLSSEATDLAISKGVEGEGQELPGHGHAGLVATRRSAMRR